MVLHVTNICNMRCQHCFVEFETKPKDLKLPEFEELSKHVNDLVWLDIGGGEPSLRKDLPQIISLFRMTELSIPTNGWFVDRVMKTMDAVAKLVPGKLIVTVSLDGFRDTHDEIRQAGSFDRAIESIKQLASLGTVRLKVNTCVCERNYAEIPAFMEYVQTNLPVDYQGLLLLRGSPINPIYRLPGTDQLRDLGKRVRPIQQRYSYGRTGVLGRIQRNFQELKWNLQIDTLEQEAQLVPCLGGQSHVVVYANGDVAPCEILPSVGNIRRTPFTDIVRSDAWKQSVTSIKRGDCNCTHDCNMMENILFNPATYPKLLFGV